MRKIVLKEDSKNKKVIDPVPMRVDLKQLVKNYIDKNEEYMWKRIKHEFVQKVAKLGQKTKSVQKQEVEDYIYGYLKQLLAWLSHDHQSQQINRSALSEELKRKLKQMTKLATEAQQRIKRRDEKIVKMEKLMNTFTDKLNEKVIEYRRPGAIKTEDTRSRKVESYPNFAFLLNLMVKFNSNQLQKIMKTTSSLLNELNLSKKTVSQYHQFSTQLLLQLRNKDIQIEGMKKKLKNTETNYELVCNAINQILLKDELLKIKLKKSQQKNKRMEQAHEEMRGLINSYAKECWDQQKSFSEIERKLIGKQQQLLSIKQEIILLRETLKEKEYLSSTNQIKLRQANQVQFQQIQTIKMEHNSHVQFLNNEIIQLKSQLESAKKKNKRILSVQNTCSQLYVPDVKIKISTQSQTQEDISDQDDSKSSSSYILECDNGTQYEQMNSPSQFTLKSQMEIFLLNQKYQQEIMGLKQQLDLMRKQEAVILKQMQKIKIEYAGAKFEVGQLRHRLINYLEEDHDDYQGTENERVIKELELSISQLQNQNSKLRKNNQELLETIEYANSLFSCQPIQKQSKSDHFLLRNRIGYNFTETTQSYSYDRSEKSCKSQKEHSCAMVSNYQTKYETQDEDGESKDESSQNESRPGTQLTQNTKVTNSFGEAITRLLAEFVNQENKQSDKLRAFTTLVELLKPQSVLNEKFNKYVKLRRMKNTAIQDQPVHEQMSRSGLKDKLYKFLTQN